MKLLERDRASEAWLRIKADLEKDLATLRANNDHPLNAEETAFLRGRIFEVKKLIAAEKAEPLIQE